MCKWPISHFRVRRGLCIETRLSAQPLIWKSFFHSHANKTHLHKKGCALGLILKVRVFGTRKWPIVLTTNMAALSRGGKPRVARYLTLALGP